MATDVTKIDLSKLSMDELFEIYFEPDTLEELAEEEEAMKYLPDLDDDEDADITVQTVMMKKKRGKSKK